MGRPLPLSQPQLLLRPPQPHLLRPDPLPPSATAFSVPSSLNSLNTRRRSQRLRPLPLSQLLRRASLWLPPLLPQPLSQLRPPRHQLPTERPRLPRLLLSRPTSARAPSHG